MRGDEVSHAFTTTGAHVIVVHASNGLSEQTANDTLQVINRLTEVSTLPNAMNHTVSDIETR